MTKLPIRLAPSSSFLFFSLALSFFPSFFLSRLTKSPSSRSIQYLSVHQGFLPDSTLRASLVGRLSYFVTLQPPLLSLFP